MKTRRSIIISLIFIGTSQMSAVGTPSAEKKEFLQLKYPKGRTALYKNSYSIEFLSDKGKQFYRGVSPSWRVEVRIDGEWKSQEEVRLLEPSSELLGDPEDIWIWTTIKDSYSGVRDAGKRLTGLEFNSNIEALNNRELSWKISPDGQVRQFKPQFPAFLLPRQDIIVDLWQIWIPEVCPTLPEKPVGKGDTWTDERTFELPYIGLGEKALIKFKSNYSVKEIKKKKKTTLVSIKEIRQVSYRSWMYAGVVSILIEGEGKGIGDWVIDNNQGIVLSHHARFALEQSKLGLPKGRKLSQVNSEYILTFKRKLEKLKKK